MIATASNATHDALAAVLAIVNLAVCAGILWAAVCRIHMMSATETAPRFKAVYVGLLVAAFASGFSPPLFREQPGPGQVLMGVAVLYLLTSGSTAWRNGPPAYTRRSRQPEDTELLASDFHMDERT